MPTTTSSSHQHQVRCFVNPEQQPWFPRPRSGRGIYRHPDFVVISRWFSPRNVLGRGGPHLFTNPKSKPKPCPKPKPKPCPKPKPNLKTNPKPKPNPKTNPKTKPKAKPCPKPSLNPSPIKNPTKNNKKYPKIISGLLDAGCTRVLCKTQGIQHPTHFSSFGCWMLNLVWPTLAAEYGASYV